MAEYKVLVPLDGSRTSEQALLYLDALRSLGESQIRLLSIVDESADFHALTQDEAAEREANVLATYLREVSADIQVHLGINVEAKVLRGTPARCIIEEAQAFSPDLLVISTHGRSGVSRWRLGSVADKVIRGAACNTLVIGPKAAELGTWLDARILPPFRSVLVPLDGSALAEEALPVAQTFVRSFGSNLHLVRVVSIPTVPDGLAGEGYMPGLLDSMIAAAQTYMASTAQRVNGPTPAAKTAVLVGPVAFRLDDYIRENGIDLIVMTSHGRSGFSRTALGSVTDRLIGGPAPVLVVRARPGV